MNRTMTFQKALLLVTLIPCAPGCSYIPAQANDYPSMNSAATVLESQTLNPSASDNRKIPTGLDPSVSVQVQDAYVKTFAPKKASAGGNGVFLGLGGVGSGQ